VFIGAAPGTEWLPDSILRDDKGFVYSGMDLSTADVKTAARFTTQWKEKRSPFLLESSVPGIFVAGDVRHGSIKRAASAVGEGSIAVQFAHQYLASF
jgi:thioredoxin reductase (NADPH)